jgi:hypothetical protein
MALLDQDGRLFGRVNIIDAVVLAIVVAAVPAAAIGYRSLRQSSIEVVSVEPSTITAGESARVHLAGSGFRPYLQAYLGAAGQPFILSQVDRRSQQTKYLLSSAIGVELQVQALAPGTYDLFLYDQGRQVASRPAALTVVAPQTQATRQVKVRFYPPPETVPLMQIGDRDQPGGALVTDVRPTNELSDVMEMHLADQDSVWTGQKMTGQLVEVTLDVPEVESGPNTWTYRDQPVLAGNIFLLTTDRYRLHGVVTWIGDVDQTPAAAR